MIKLSKRMKAVASMVTKGNIVADVGTDHGYVPIALISENKIPSAIALDINRGPLERANEHVKRQSLEDKIKTRLSDGVEAIEVGEVDSIIIAGMGGELIIHILTDGETVCRSVKELILQPQSDIDKVRAFLRERRYRIVDEDMILEEGKYYPMMRVIPVEHDDTWDKLATDEIKACDIYGPILLKNGNPVLRKYLVKQHQVLRDIIAKLQKQQPTEAILRRIMEKEKELTYNESAYTILGAIKNAGI